MRLISLPFIILFSTHQSYYQSNNLSPNPAFYLHPQPGRYYFLILLLLRLLLRLFRCDCTEREGCECIYIWCILVWWFRTEPLSISFHTASLKGPKRAKSPFLPDLIATILIHVWFGYCPRPGEIPPTVYIAPSLLPPNFPSVIRPLYSIPYIPTSTVTPSATPSNIT